ncbi:MAG: c-type cytochrome [Actinomycetota bacterium]
MTDKIPPALRPGKTDDVIESERLTGIIRWAVIVVVFFAVFLPLYWLREPTRMLNTEKGYAEVSLERGHEYYSLTTDLVTGKENPHGKECARCHGVDLEGGTNDFLDPATGQKTLVQVPELQTVFSRYETPPPGFKDARTFIRETIERGRPGTDMPTWGNKYGGPLTDQELDDIVNFIESAQKAPKVEAGTDGQTIFSTNCSPCHGIGGAGGSGPAFKGGTEEKMFPNVDDQIAFVEGGSKPGQAYGTSGKGTGRMPPWKGRLTDEQIRSVVEYERGL